MPGILSARLLWEMADRQSDSGDQCRNEVRSVVLVSPTFLPAITEGSLLDKVGNDLSRFIILYHTVHLQIYSYLPGHSS